MSSYFAYSSDGHTWTKKIAPTAGAWEGVIYGGGLFLAFNGSAQCATSSDGVNWSLTYGLEKFGTGAYGVGTSGGMYVATTSGVGPNQLACSSDASTWHIITPPITTQYLSKVAFGSGLFVALADYNTNFITSPDGVTWTEQNPGPGGLSIAFSNLVYNGTNFVAMANDGGILLSSNGITWTSPTTPPLWSGTSQVYALASNGSTVAAQNNATSSPSNVVGYSATGDSWTMATMPTADLWSAVGHGVGTYVAVSTGVDGAYGGPSSWTAMTMPVSQAWTGVAGNASVVVAVGSGAGAPNGIIMMP